MSVDTTRDISIHCLCKRLTEAQKTITKHIFNSNVTMLPYRKGSRDYTPLEHLQVVNAHIAKHLKDITKKIK